MPNPHPKPGPGRPKGAVSKKTIIIKQIAQKHGVDAIKMLADMVNNKKENSGSRIAAAKELLDRGFGKSPQPLDGDGEGGDIKLAVRWLVNGK